MREKGFYWVIAKGHFLFKDWQIAYWDGFDWHLILCESDNGITDETFSSIDEKRIVRNACSKLNTIENSHEKSKI